MANFAYLRVSTDQQDVDNQKHGILEYCNNKGIGSLSFVSDSKSAKIKWRDRGCGDLIINQAQTGDVIVFGEISRVARSTLQVLEVLEYCTKKGINVHIAKQNMVLDSSIQSTITATILGLAAEIERDFIRMRTTESLAHKRQQIKDQGYFISNAGEKRTALGRPKGQAENTKLDKRRSQIKDFLKKGVGKRSIAKIVECSPTTLYSYIKKHDLEAVE